MFNNRDCEANLQIPLAYSLGEDDGPTFYEVGKIFSVQRIILVWGSWRDDILGIMAHQQVMFGVAKYLEVGGTT